MTPGAPISFFFLLKQMTTWRYATFDGDMSEEELSFQEEKLLRASLQSKKPIDTAPPPATSQYSSSRNAAINLARKQRREIQRATNSRDPEPRSLRTQATPPLPPKAGTTTAAAGASTAHPRNSFISRGTVSSAHDSLHLSTRSPPPLVQPPLPPSAAEETAALTAHAVATVRSTPTVPAPQPPSLAPEVCTMEPGKVRGTTEWLQKHASVRRLENAKPEQVRAKGCAYTCCHLITGSNSYLFLHKRSLPLSPPSVNDEFAYITLFLSYPLPRLIMTSLSTALRWWRSTC